MNLNKVSYFLYLANEFFELNTKGGNWTQLGMKSVNLDKGGNWTPAIFRDFLIKLFSTLLLKSLVCLSLNTYTSNVYQNYCLYVDYILIARTKNKHWKIHFV